MSIEKLSLTTPPSRFFQGLSTDYTNNMTYAEFLLGILKKLNETIADVNANTDFREEYSGKIEELEAEMDELRNEMVLFEADINTQINNRFNQIVIELQSMIATALVQANAYTDARAAQLEDEIQAVSVGAITVYDPTTGILSPLQSVIDNLYGSTRENALTATEYDALDLTATAYDAYQISAFDYDKNGKTILA